MMKNFIDTSGSVLDKVVINIQISIKAIEIEIGCFAIFRSRFRYIMNFASMMNNRTINKGSVKTDILKGSSGKKYVKFKESGVKSAINKKSLSYALNAMYAIMSTKGENENHINP
jgi:hypothetical protein